MTLMWWILLPLIGALGGFLAGMLGVGGGVIFIPILQHSFGLYHISGPERVRFTPVSYTHIHLPKERRVIHTGGGGLGT